MSITGALDERFGDSGGLVRFEDGPGGLTRVAVNTPAGSALVYLHGAHVAEWTPAGEEPVLFISGESFFEKGRAIRGGVPVIFPWFGAKQGHPDWPMHGVARTADWRLEGVSSDGDGVTLRLCLSGSGDRAGLFELEYIIAIQRTLTMELIVRNPGRDAMEFEEALHSYFNVGDVREISIQGLQGAEYLDKTDGFKRKREDEPAVRIAAETDRVYQNTAATCTIADPVKRRNIVVEKQGSASTVVWNPWVAKAKSMADFGDEEWAGMVCVETANVAENRVILQAGAEHRMSVKISVSRLSGGAGKP